MSYLEMVRRSTWLGARVLLYLGVMGLDNFEHQLYNF